MVANPDSESQRRNAQAPRQKRIESTALTVVSPEIEDAELLYDTLDPEIRQGLMQARGDLPKGDQFDNARGNAMLSMQVRHDMIVKMRAQGMRPDRIARGLGVRKAIVDKVIKHYFTQVEKDLRSQRMDEFVLMMAEGYLEDMDRLSDVVARSSHPTAVVGAIKARQEAREKYVNLLADFGFINRKPTEVNISGDGATVDARTQNVIVVSQDQIKAITKELLQQKREVRHLPENPVEDDRIANLVVTGDDA